MAVDQLPGQVREFVAYLDGVLARLDQGGGWCAVFWQRDPDGMQACLDGREIPPWDVVEALIQDLGVAYGSEAARAEAERARPLHAAAQAAHDARPGGRDALGDRFDVMLREQRYAAERQAELGRRLASATTQEEADALRLDLAWARDDHERAVRRCAELQSRMTALDHRTMGDRADVIRRGRVRDEGALRRDQAVGEEAFRRVRVEDAGTVHRGHDGGAGPGERAWADGQVSGGAGAGERGAAGHGDGFVAMPQQRGTAPAAAPETADTSHAPQRPAPAPAPATSPGPGAAEGVHPGYGTHQLSGTGAFERAYDPQQAPTATASDHAHGADTPRQSPSAAPPPAAKQRKRRRGGARFAGVGEAEAGGVVVPPTAVPDLPAAPARRGRTPRGARFAGAVDAADGRTQEQAAPTDTGDTALRETADTVATLVRLRSEGRTGEAHALLVEVAHWPADRFPLLAAELQRAGLGADWATLLWEAASLPAERLVAAADALVAAGRSTDGEQVLRQGVARPAGEIGAAVLALVAEGRRREVSALLDAYVRVRTPEEAARSAEPDPRTLVPLLLTAAKAVSQERHWDLVHALRVAGFST
ncbi:hypothetical protein [Streptomyces griseorubiginosus]|uniref:hypothetical protein n=1 Tax=Streptomyces griseorubiginosus TaxID=67304 RepID=UPI0036E50B77